MKNGNVRAGRVLALFIRIAIDGVIDEIGADAAVVQQRIALARGAVANDFLAAFPGVDEEAEQVTLHPLHPFAETAVIVQREHSRRRLLLSQLRDTVADVEATARVITDAAERRELLAGVAANWNRTDLDVMLEHSPLIEVTIPGYPA